MLMDDEIEEQLDVYTLDEFRATCIMGFLTDNDGYGQYGHKQHDGTVLVANRYVNPSNAHSLDYSFHVVVWYNK